MLLARISSVLFFSFLGLASAEEPPLVFAINSAVNPLLNIAFIDETIQSVRHSVAPRVLEVKFVELPELEKMMQERSADFFLSTSSTLRRFEPDGLRDMVTASSPFSEDPNKSEGSLIIANASRKDLNSIGDLRNARLAAGRPTAFGMYLAAMGEVAKAGYDPKTFFSSTRFYGLDRDKIIEDVLSGKADAGILRICYFEDAVNRKVVKPDQVKFINLQKDSSHACLHSTSLYPNWSIGSSPSVAPALISAVTVALISQKPSGIGIHWSIASDYTELDNLLRNLNLGSFEKNKKLWFRNEVYKYRYWIFAFGAAILLIIGNLILVTQTVRIRTKQLKAALRRENKIFKEAKEANQRLLRLQRAGVVSQVSSLIAHELNQPLAGIKLYSSALKRAQKNGSLTPEKLEEITEDIRADVDMASSIVDRVRLYAKGEQSSREVVAVKELVEKAKREFDRQIGFAVKVEIVYLATPYANLNILEFELVIINVLRNAAQAMAEQNIKNPIVHLELTQTDRDFYIRVWDKARIEKNVFDHLNEPINSHKTQGLGLGLQIIKGIVENHGGRLRFERTAQGGLAVVISLPVAERKDHHEQK